MVITWYGQSCFKIQSGDLIVAIDPFSKDIGLVSPRFRTDILLVTHEHFDHSYIESLTGEPFIVQGPGEYEAKGVYMHGISTFHDKIQGKDRGMNTAYKIEIEEINILHLGDFGEGALREETLDIIGDLDVLMIPVGGVYTIDGEEAAKAIRQIEPKIVIPMHYKIPGLKADLNSLEPFLKEMGLSSSERLEKLVIKKKDFTEDSKTSVVVLKTA